MISANRATNAYASCLMGLTGSNGHQPIQVIAESRQRDRERRTRFRELSIGKRLQSYSACLSNRRSLGAGGRARNSPRRFSGSRIPSVLPRDASVGFATTRLNVNAVLRTTLAVRALDREERKGCSKTSRSSTRWELPQYDPATACAAPRSKAPRSPTDASFSRALVTAEPASNYEPNNYAPVSN